MVHAVVFLYNVDYNCQIMSFKEENEKHLAAMVDAVETHEITKKGRIEMAAFAIQPQVARLDALKAEQDEKHGAIESAPRWAGLFRGLGAAGGYSFPSEFIDESKGGIEQIEYSLSMPPTFTLKEATKIGMKASREGIRAKYKLSRFQARRAVSRSRKVI